MSWPFLPPAFLIACAVVEAEGNPGAFYHMPYLLLSFSFLPCIPSPSSFSSPLLLLFPPPPTTSSIQG